MYREQIPALADAIYLNTGTFGPSPVPVLDAIRHALDLIERHGPYSPLVRETVERASYEETRREAACLLGVDPAEIVLTRSASDGTNIIAHGLDWHPGDEVVITNEEHQSGMLPWFLLSRRQGIKVRVADISPDPALTLQNIADQVNERTRLVFASHVSCISGIRLPVRDICALAHDQAVLAVIDGAHALGQFPVKMGDIGCDAYIGCGHKWLLGPQGTSLLYIAREHLDTFQPSWIGWGAEEEWSIQVKTQSYSLHSSARRFEFGTKQYPLFAGLGCAIKFIAGIGPEAIQAQVQPLARRAKARIDEVPGWERLTPMEPDLCSGIVTIRLGPDTPYNMKDLLWNSRRLLVNYFPPYRILRLSIAFFTLQEEVDQAIDALLELGV